jgi:uncharacterized protein (TIGR03118 family)
MKKCLLLLVLGLTATFSQGQQSGYSQTNLVADTAGIAAHTDSQLSNPWGIALLPGQPFWIANNNGGTSTLYDASGNKNSLVVQIPAASMNPCNPGCPTGIVANSSGADFGGAQFIFDTEDGIVVSWSQGVVGVKVVDNSAASAVYKGLALLSNGAGNFLLAANFRSGKVDVFDRAFQPASLSGSFTDPGLPAGFAPHGIHIINNQVFVAYAMQDGPKHDPVVGAGNGVVDIFDMNGTFVKRLASGGALNAPWGVALSPANFGQFSNAILVGDFGDGTINAFDSHGNMMGQLKDTSGNVLVNAGLWELLFGLTSSDAQTLYFTAGGADQTHGLFATLKAAQAVSSGDFSLSLSSTTANVNRGSATNINVSASAVGGFNNAITLSCSGLPAGVSCAFSPATITPGTSSATSVLTLSVSQGYNPVAMWLPFSGIGLFGLAFATPNADTKSTKRLVKRSVIGGAVVLIAVLILMATGCGMNGGNHMNNMNNGATSFLITGTSGAIMHSAQVSLMVN